jgi:hypothetical protein
MKKTIILILLALLPVLAFTGSASAQCDTIAKATAKYIVPPFVSDGQSYRALLMSGQTAEFHATLYAGTTYRIASSSAAGDGSILFSIYDQDRNLIFSNSQHNNATYWDFKVTTTVDVVIEANLNPQSGKDSGCAVLLIGFKQ